ncbi:MAG: hypothetical protein D6757_01470 [Alphaproteobacteria bacterium]|nr:MAG: hypothetical protein D6757_01470 [Alphaproteobacteria bacterium]
MGLWIIRLIAVALLLVGLVLWVLPIPFGIFVVAIAGLLLVATTPALQRLLARLRARSPRLDRGLQRLAPRLPQPWRRILRSTEPPVF